MCQAKVIIVFDCKLRRRASRNENKIEKISTSWKEKKSIDLNKKKLRVGVIQSVAILEK